MVLTKDELIKSLQNEVHILTHLISKVEPSMVDYRPTPKQRSTIELLQYLTLMGPHLTMALKAGAFDGAAWGAADAEAKTKDLAGVKAAIEAQSAWFAENVGSMSDADFRKSVALFGPGSENTVGGHMVFLVLGGYAAYRTQLFCYLKANGRDELNTFNLWQGVDGQMQAA